MIRLWLWVAAASFLQILQVSLALAIDMCQILSNFVKCCQIWLSHYIITRIKVNKLWIGWIGDQNCRRVAVIEFWQIPLLRYKINCLGAGIPWALVEVGCSNCFSCESNLQAGTAWVARPCLNKTFQSPCLTWEEIKCVHGFRFATLAKLAICFAICCEKNEIVQHTFTATELDMCFPFSPTSTDPS